MAETKRRKNKKSNNHNSSRRDSINATTSSAKTVTTTTKTNSVTPSRTYLKIIHKTQNYSGIKEARDESRNKCVHA